nr:MAG TPA: hypothetical protein [Caudoviricetes sp.]DAU23558.1 MAG TPA: hypothetical protein [Caudoviricetes sp.]
MPRPWAKTGGGWKPRTSKPAGTAFLYINKSASEQSGAFLIPKNRKE